MGQQRVNIIALIHTEMACANFVLENDVDCLLLLNPVKFKSGYTPLVCV